MAKSNELRCIGLQQEEQQDAKGDECCEGKHQHVIVRYAANPTADVVTPHCHTKIMHTQR